MALFLKQRELGEAKAEIKRLNAEVTDAANKNRQLINISSKYPV